MGGNTGTNLNGFGWCTFDIMIGASVVCTRVIGRLSLGLWTVRGCMFSDEGMLLTPWVFWRVACDWGSLLVISFNDRGRGRTWTDLLVELSVKGVCVILIDDGFRALGSRDMPSDVSTDKRFADLTDSALLLLWL